MTAVTPAELPCSIVLAGSNRNRRKSRGLSRWSRNVRRWSWWRSNVDAWSFVSSKNNYVLNRSGKWLREQYEKHHPIKSTIDQSRPTNQATEVERLIRERSDCDKASNSSKSGRIATNWPNDWTNTSTSTSTPLEVGVGQRSRSGVKGLEPARGQEPTAEALKI